MRLCDYRVIAVVVLLLYFYRVVFSTVEIALFDISNSMKLYPSLFTHTYSVTHI